MKQFFVNVKEFFTGISLKQYLILTIVLLGWSYLVLNYHDVNLAAPLIELDQQILAD